MTTTTALAVLTETLDGPGIDIAEFLRGLATGARVAVHSYLGLSVAITTNGSPLDFAVLEDGVRPADIRSSLMVPLSAVIGAGVSAEPVITLILYAGTPGAFIDLAADLAWLTAHPVGAFPLDEHRMLRQLPDRITSLSASITINQALGVLIGRGATPEQADVELDGRAAGAGVDRHVAASLILAALSHPEPDLDVEAQ